jgi:hypothetical protein
MEHVVVTFKCLFMVLTMLSVVLCKPNWAADFNRLIPFVNLQLTVFGKTSELTDQEERY